MIIAIMDSLKRPPFWSDLDRFGSSPLAKLSILMPIVGYLILFNEKIIEFIEMSPLFIFESLGSASYRLFFFYFGLFFVGLASLVFQLRCPRVIRISPTIFEFVDVDKRILSLTRIKEVFDLIRKFYAELDGGLRDFEAFDMQERIRNLKLDESPDRYMDADEKDKRDKFENEVLKTYWLLRDASRRNGRKIVFYSYVTGFALLAIPTIDTFIEFALLLGRRYLRELLDP